VRSANRAARAAERTLLAQLRPVLMPSRLDDPPQKVGFFDEKWLVVKGGGGAVDVRDGAVYLAIALRNAGTGIAVLHGWNFYPGRETSDHAAPEDFRRLTRDLYVPVGEVGFWQGALRDPAEPAFADIRRAIEERQAMTIDVLYSDHEGGQRTITRFGLLPRDDGSWIAAVGRHWNLDRPDPR